ncbi:MAG: hypothetical protein MZV70_33055 [Desulfobacterales bacterium]|nr:hypothetical protein [Desulfobacterales bacterium]
MRDASHHRRGLSPRGKRGHAALGKPRCAICFGERLAKTALEASVKGFQLLEQLSR